MLIKLDAILLHNQSRKQKRKTMKKGTYVSLYVDGIDIYGTTIENESKSPIQSDPDRMVIRVKWEDNSESIERVDSLMQLSK